MGFSEDPISVLFEVFVLCLVCILLFAAVSEVSGMFDIIPGYTNTVGQALVSSFPILDQAILLVMVFMMLVALILAWFIPSHPALILGYVVVVVVITILAPIVTNIYSTIVNTAYFTPYATLFPIANAIMSNLTLIIVVFSAMLAVVSYGKPRTDRAGVLTGLG